MKASWDGEEDPLRALQRGETAPFERFVASEAATLVAFFVRLGASHEEAEDLCQDVLLKIFRSADGYEPRSQFTAFVMRIAKNAWIDRHRRRGVRPEAPTPGEADVDVERPDPAAGGAEPGRALEVGEDVARLHAALGSLPDGQRAAFELAVMQELPYARIADVLDVPVGTVKSRVFHAVRRLRALLDGEDA